MQNFLSTAVSLLALSLTPLPAYAESKDPLSLYPDNYKVIVENDRVRVLDFELKKGAKENTHNHPAHVVYVLTGFKIRFTFPDGKTTIRETKHGDVLYSDAVAHASENIGDTDAHGILVELKTPAGKNAAAVHPADPDLLTTVTFITGKESELNRELLALSAPTRAELINRPTRRINSCAWKFGKARRPSKITRRRRTSKPPSKNAKGKGGELRLFPGSAFPKT